MKQDATISEDANDLTKEEQAQHRSASSRTRRLAQAQEKTGNIPLQTSNNEEQNKLVMSTKETNENGMEQDNARQQSIERSDQPMSDLAGSQVEVTEMRFSSL